MFSVLLPSIEILCIFSVLGGTCQEIWQSYFNVIMSNLNLCAFEPIRYFNGTYKTVFLEEILLEKFYMLRFVEPVCLE